jgi:hypothetical protein
MADEIYAEQVGTVWWLHVGDHRYPCELVEKREVLLPDAEPFYRRRAVVMLESGWRVSVIWGSGTYSTNHTHPFGDVRFDERPHFVEVGVPWDGPWEPCSYVDEDELNDMITQMAMWPSTIAPPSWAVTGGALRPAKPATGWPEGEVPNGVDAD